MIRSLVYNNENQYCNKGFTKEAIAGLASKEDFTSVKLKSSNDPSELLYQPYTDFMLIRIKGRRHCQPRLIKPSLSSLNNTDCFILKAASTVYLYIGQQANIIERSKSNAIFEYIRAKRELGNSTDIRFVILKNLDLNEPPAENVLCDEADFFNCFKAREGVQTRDEEVDTELYDRLINEFLNVYEVVRTTSGEDENIDDESLLSHYTVERVENMNVLSHHILSDRKVFLFDFGTEFYVWSGSNASSMCKKAGMLIGRELYNKGVSVSSCQVNRPEWAIFTRQIQNMETVLFKEKFFDWPAQRSPSTQHKPTVFVPRVPIKSVSSSSSSASTSPRDVFDFEMLSDAELKNLVHRDKPIVNLVLEQTNLGRGNHYFDPVERRSFDIVTEQVNMYTLVNNQLIECDQAQFGHLVDKYSYLIKWHYKVNAVGFRTLKGDLSRHNLVTGRDRYALFYWHGNKSSSSEKGTSALLSLDLINSNHSLAASLGSNIESIESSNDVTERVAASVPHVQVYQYKEPAAFCRLFNGSMCIELFDHDNEWRMFQIRGEIDQEAHLVEIEDVSPASLRTKTSFFFVNKSHNKSFIYHGLCSSQLHRRLIVSCARKYLQTSQIVELIENDTNESIYLKQVFGSRFIERNELTKSEEEYTPRLFLMTTLHGKFEMIEIENPIQSDQYCPFPFHQFHLYDEKQPALFMLDTGTQIYIWQGWFDSSADTLTSNDATDGSTRLRFMQMRKCAMMSALKYWTIARGEDKPFVGKVVYAGLEPIEFTNMFPAWSINELARASSINDGKTQDQQDDIKDVLGQLNRNCYSLAVLRERPLPDGVNPLKLECYLSDQEFEELLQMSKESFASLPSWKQVNLKKKANLF